MTAADEDASGGRRYGAGGEGDPWLPKVVAKTVRSVIDPTRAISYHISNPDNKSDPIAVLFYPLGGSSSQVTKLVYDQATSSGKAVSRQYKGKARVLCVDRPNCRGTSGVSQQSNAGVDAGLRRISQTVSDVFEVLEHENIDPGTPGGFRTPTDIFVSATCLGHPYGVAFAKALVHKQMEVRDALPAFRLQGLTLVSPWGDPCGPSALGAAQFASSWVPSMVMSCIGCIQGNFARLSFNSMGGSIIRNAIGDGSLAKNGGEWTEEDVDAAAEMGKKLNGESAAASQYELNLAVSRMWGSWIYGTKGNGDFEVVIVYLRAKMREVEGGATPGARQVFRIHCARKDRMTSPESIRWLNGTHYSGLEMGQEDGNVKVHSEIEEHALMTMWKGPPRHPKLFLEM
eukprot:Hpha_TRINITY_DN9379_c0_g1::TRINITY_DN9379_c0_g1_i1::g.25991::m.25991